jgi:hypothetical protein
MEDARVQLSLLPDAKQCNELILKLKLDKAERIAFLLNNWWWDRNRRRDGEAGHEPQDIVVLTMRQVQEFKWVEISDRPMQQHQTQRRSEFS